MFIMACNPVEYLIRLMSSVDLDCTDSSLDRKRFKALEISPQQTLPLLHLAAVKNDVNTLEKISTLYRKTGKSLNHVYCGFTALDLALRYNKRDAVEFFLKQPDTRMSVPPFQHIPTLNNAIYLSLPELVELLFTDSRVRKMW